MKIIFLDFDGVLVNRASFYHRSGGMATGHPDCVKALNRITDETDARIVVSSTWRLGNKVIRLREILGSWGVTGKVIDRTPSLERIEGRVYTAPPRGAEIQSFIDDSRRQITKFVILDDDDDMIHLTPRLVQTKFEIGLTEADADRAIVLLQEK